jgi:hypothetical protein
MSAVPDAITEPTDNGTLRLNIEPAVKTGDQFEPFFCPELART